MKDLLITGTGSYLGRNLARIMLQTGRYEHIYGIDTVDPKIPGLHHIQADITNPAALPIDFKGDIVHAKEAYVAGWDENAGSINRRGTESILNIKNEGHLIHISSTAVYDIDSPHHNLAEGAYNPHATTYHGSYAESKAAAEQLVTAAAVDRHIPPIILRPHLLYGPGNIPAPLTATSKRLLLPNRGNSGHTFTHIKHLIDAIDAALKTTPTETRAYNIVDASPMSVRGAVDLLTDPSPRVIGAPTDLLLYANSFLHRWSDHELLQLGYERTYNIDAAKRDLGYNPGSFTIGPRS